VETLSQRSDCGDNFIFQILIWDGDSYNIKRCSVLRRRIKRWRQGLTESGYMQKLFQIFRRCSGQSILIILVVGALAMAVLLTLFSQIRQYTTSVAADQAAQNANQTAIVALQMILRKFNSLEWTVANTGSITSNSVPEIKSSQLATTSTSRYVPLFLITGTKKGPSCVELNRYLLRPLKPPFSDQLCDFKTNSQAFVELRLDSSGISGLQATADILKTNRKRQHAVIGIPHADRAKVFLESQEKSLYDPNESYPLTELGAALVRFNSFTFSGAAITGIIVTINDEVNGIVPYTTTTTTTTTIPTPTISKLTDPVNSKVVTAGQYQGGNKFFIDGQNFVANQTKVFFSVAGCPSDGCPWTPETITSTRITVTAPIGPCSFPCDGQLSVKVNGKKSNSKPYRYSGWCAIKQTSTSPPTCKCYKGSPSGSTNCSNGEYGGIAPVSSDGGCPANQCKNTFGMPFNAHVPLN